MPMKLEEIEPGEISLVDVPANKRKFLFKKADLEGSSKTVPNGILVCPQCDHQEALIDFVKSASELCPECGADLLNSATRIIFKRRRNMKASLKELIEKLFEDDEGEEELTEEELEQIEKAETKIPKDALNAVKGALNLLTKYKSVLPDDVQAAIKALAKVAAYGYGYPAKKKGDDEDEEDDGVAKAGARLSKDTVGKLKKIFAMIEKAPDAVKLLKELIPTESKKGDTEVLVETLGGKLDEILKALKGQASEEEEDDEKKGDLKKELEKVQKTLKRIAETKGFSKLLKGIGEEEEEEEEEAEEEEEEEEEKGTKQKTKKKAAYKWPFTLTPPQKKKD